MFHARPSFARIAPLAVLLGALFVLPAPVQAVTPKAAPKAEAEPPAAPPAAPRAALVRYWEEPSFAAPAQEAARPSPQGGTSLTLLFSPQEALCKSHYREDWLSVCGRRTGLAGKPASGVALSPALEGEWRWQGDMALAFRPRNAWPADQEFTVDIPAEALPSGTELVTGIRFRTRPLMANIAGDFKFDPQDAKIMAVSGVISFNYPVDRAGVRERFRISASAKDRDAGLLYGDPVLTWSGDQNLAFSVPVLALPAKASALRVELLPGAMAASGGRGGLGAEFNAPLPGKDQLFSLTGAVVSLATTEKLNARQILALRFSLPAAPKNVAPSLTALLLPRDRIETALKPERPYRWWSTEEISNEVLARSTPIALVALGDPDTPNMEIPFGFSEEIEPGRCILVNVADSATGRDGLRLAKGMSILAQAPEFGAEARIMQNGGILALAGDKKLSLYARNLDAMAYTVAQIRPEFLNHFIATNDGSFERPFLYGQLRDRLSVLTDGEIPLARRDAQSAQFAALDLGAILKNGRKGLFHIVLDGRREGANYARDERFVLVTDLGLIHKKMPTGQSLVYVASLSSGQPRGNVNVAVLGANGLPVFSGVTDRDGRVAVPDLSGLEREKRPTVVTAEQGGDLAFLPYDSRDRAVDYSRFDVGGAQSVEGLDAFLFTQRGIYRPGETAHFGLMIKQPDWAPLGDPPLYAEIRDPRGARVVSRPVALKGGMGEFACDLAPTAPTGTYNMALRLGGADGLLLQNLSFRVEEFQPDTLRLTVTLGSPDAPQPKGWLRPRDIADQKLDVRLGLMNLFGAPAAQHNAGMALEAQPAWLVFRAYDGWTFYDAAPLAASSREDLPEQQTDDEGDAVWPVPLDVYGTATCRLIARGEGFDAAGGRSVKASASILLSPLDKALGWKTGSNLSFLRQGGEAFVDLIAVNPDLEPLAVPGLTLETVDVTYARSLIRDDRGQYRYDNVRKERVAETRPFDLAAAGGRVALDLRRPGSRMLLARDAEGAVLLKISYVVAGNAPAAYGEDREPLFYARLNKQDYEPGEEMEIYLSTPYKGAGLITVERDNVVAQAWFTGDGGDRVEKLRLPQGFEGKAYLNVTYFRALDDKDIFTKPLAAFIVPFRVNTGARDLGLELKPAIATPSAEGDLVVRPGASLGVDVTARRPARAIVFAVDEGILQITSYRTPDPLDAFLGNRALEVETSQYFDLLMPEYALMQSALAAVGGGEGMNFAAMGQNPFRRPGDRPMVFWSGLVDVGPEPLRVDIPVPSSFNGQIRVMAVALGPDGVSAARADVKAQAEVVIQPSLPLFAAPGDVFEATFTLTDMSGLAPAPGAPAGRPLRLEVRTDAGLSLQNPPPGTLELFHAREYPLRLRLRAGDLPGGASVTLVVSPADGAPGEAVTRSAGLSVRPAMPRATDIMLGRMNAGEHTVPFSRALYAPYSSMTAGLSALPLPTVRALLAYLERYPYGCTEQLISTAFPALAILRYPELAPHGEAYTPDALRAVVLRTLDTISARHQGGADFALWPGGGQGDLFLSAYAMDFLTTAAEAGVVPPAIFNEALRELSAAAATPPADITEARATAYAVWVLTRNGILTTNHIATLTAWCKRYQPDWEQDISAVFMAGAWKLMMNHAEADRLIAAYKPGPLKGWSDGDYFDGLLRRAFYLSVLAAQFPERLPDSQPVLDEILDLTSAGYFGSLSAAQAARALMFYSRAVEAGNIERGIAATDAAGKPISKEQGWDPKGRFLLEASLQTPEAAPVPLNGLASVTFRASGPAFWQVESTGFDRDIPAEPLIQGMELRREIRTPDGKPATSLAVGDEVVVAILARVHNVPARQIAITDLLPACLEMIVAEGGDAQEVGTGKGARINEVSMSPDYADRREDRLLLFTPLGTAESVFRYRARVIASGDFILPPLYGEAMYNPTIRARSAPGRLMIGDGR